jgi:hypothetical protein
MKKIILFFTIAVLSFSCSKGGKTASKLSITVGSLASVDLSAYVNGGAMLYGHNNNTGDRFAINLSDIAGDLELELTNGNWIFSGFLWSGDNAFEGDHYCAYVSSTLAGGEMSIPLAFNNITCSNNNFSINPFNDGGTIRFPVLEIEGCRNLSNITNEYDYCDEASDDESLAMSYKVKLKTFSQGSALTTGSAIVSDCLDASSTGSVVTTLRLPQGNGLLPYDVEIESFLDSDCSGERGSLNRTYTNGLMVNDVSVFAYDNSGETTKVFHDVTEIEACGASTADSYNLFSTGNGSTSFPWGLCHAHQWDLIAHTTVSGSIPASSLGHSFELLRDLDFSHRMAGIPGSYDEPPINCVGLGSNFVPVGTDLWVDYPACTTTQNTALNAQSFTGGFNGNEHIISHAYFFGDDYSGAGLFRNIGAGAIIKNLIVENSEIEGEDYVGLIVGQTSSTAAVIFSNIVMHESNVDGADNVGGLIGGDSASTGSATINDIIAANVKVDGSNDVGGLIGSFSFPTSTLMNLYFNGAIHVDNSSNNGSRVGGLIGSLSSSSNTLVGLVSKGAITGNFDKGAGLIGYASGGSNTVSDARSEMALASSYNFVAGGNIGGLIGYTAGLDMSDAYFSGSLVNGCTTAASASCEVGESVGGGTVGTLTRVYASTVIGSSHSSVTGSIAKTNSEIRSLSINADFNSSLLWTKSTGRNPILAWESISPYSKNICDHNDSYLDSIATQAGDGLGTSEGNPAYLCSPAQWTTDLDSATYIVLNDHLNLHEIGDPSLSHQVDNFSGFLDGQGHVLHGFNAAAVTNLFPSLIKNNYGTIKDLNLTNMEMSLSSDTGAILVYHNYETIKKIHGTKLSLNASINSNLNFAGIIAAKNYGEISQSILGDISIKSSVTTSGSDIGMVVGSNEAGGSLSRIAAYGHIELSGSSTTYDRVGGIAGLSDGGSIDQVSWAGELSAYQTIGATHFLGGIVGHAINGSVLTNMVTEEHAIIKIGDSLNVGGLVGSLESGSSIGTSYSSGEVRIGYCPGNPSFIDYNSCGAGWTTPGTCTGGGGETNVTTCSAAVQTWFNANMSTVGPLVGANTATISSDTFYMTPAYEILEAGHSITSATRIDSDGMANTSGDHCEVTISGATVDIDEAKHGLFIDGHNHYFDIVKETATESSFIIDLNEDGFFAVGDCTNELSGESLTFVNPDGTNRGDGTFKQYPEMKAQQTFCPSALAVGGEISGFRCDDSVEWDMVGDAKYPNAAYGFDHLIKYYLAHLSGEEAPIDAPIWKIEEGEDYPELLLDN